jgi:hypothetical protein
MILNNKNKPKYHFKQNKNWNEKEKVVLRAIVFYALLTHARMNAE